MNRSQDHTGNTETSDKTIGAGERTPFTWKRKNRGVEIRSYDSTYFFSSCSRAGAVPQQQTNNISVPFGDSVIQRGLALGTGNSAKGKRDGKRNTGTAS